MGTYLSTPVTEKGEESGDSARLAWGVVDMQGWRKSMEDAHVAQTDIVVPVHLQSDDQKDSEGRVFGVFDGHGGPEVARFCQLYMVSVLTQQATWREPTLTPAEASSTVNLEQRQDAALTPVGQALIHAFHAMDRLLNDPGRREEILRLRTDKPFPGEHRHANFIPPPTQMEDSVIGTTFINSQTMQVSNPNNDTSVPAVEPATSNTLDGHSPAGPESILNEEVKPTLPDVEAPSVPPTSNSDSETAPATTSEESATPDIVQPSDNNASEIPSDQASGDQLTTESPALPNSLDEKEAENSSVPLENEKVESTSERTAEMVQLVTTPEVQLSLDFVQQRKGAESSDNGETKDDDSNDAVGAEEAAELDQDMMDGETPMTALTSSKEEASSRASPSGKVTVMFQKLLSIGGQVVVNVVGDDGFESDNSNSVQRPSAATPTIIHNGRKICNLPDHPIHAGCTAVVAVLIGKTLTVANAGDSRAVLCRAGGRAEPLSFDHKPLQDREMQRITNAGGFVNQFGRVNGNLNLSRSIGDLKYKQVPGIIPAGQMITAEPDIVQVTLDPSDEFIILGCDGIWDCLTNEQAVAYVRERIDHKTPTEIGVEMLDTILSEDPRASQGIGGDNMTVMIVDLLPNTRSYRIRAQL